jgi:hypothetical protein
VIPPAGARAGRTMTATQISFGVVALLVVLAVRSIS